MADKITVARALTELKHIDERIEQVMTTLVPTGIAVGNKEMIDGVKIDEWEKSQKAAFDSVTDLITRKRKLKTAIFGSNQTTMVRIGSKTMSVAEAIFMKGTIAQKTILLRKLVAVKMNTDAKFENAELSLQNRFNSFLETVSATDDADGRKKITDTFMENNTPKLLDPLKLSDVISNLQQEIDGFTTDVDAVLSESNAVTHVEV